MCYSPWKKYKGGETYYVESRGGKTTYPNDVYIPCGRCVACKRRRVEDWVIRLEEEARKSVSSYFVTLTYKDDTIPWTEAGQTLYKRDLQLFIKRLRRIDETSKGPNKKDSEGRKIKYYAVGEYGGRTDRPHYHLILYNVLDKESIYKAWTLGAIHIGDSCNDKTMAYCAKYIDKPNEQITEEGIERKFSLMSKGLGKEYLTHARLEKLRGVDGTTYINRNGYDKVLPRYYKRKVFSEHEVSILNFDESGKRKAKSIKAKKKAQKIHKEDIHLHEAKSRVAQEENLRRRTNLRN